MNRIPKHTVPIWLALVVAVAWGARWTVAAEAAAPEKVAAPNDSVAKSDDGRISKLIAELGDDRFVIRQRAQDQLTRLGFAAFDAVSQAEGHGDPEIAMRAQYIVRLIRVRWVNDDDPPEVRRLLKNYDAQSYPERLATIRELGAMPLEKGAAALCRIVRYEKSPLPSKWAALAVIAPKSVPDPEQLFDVGRRMLVERSPINDAAWDKVADKIRAALDPSKRPGAEWLRTYLGFSADPATASEQWNKLAEAEFEFLRAAPQQGDRHILLQLWREQVAMLRLQKRTDDATDVMRKIAQLQDRRSLVELIDWLVKQEAWGIVDETAAKYKDDFDRNPVLLYALAQAVLAQGKSPQADKIAQRAFALSPEVPRPHLLLGYRLQESGLFEWAQREYRQVAKIVPLDRDDSAEAPQEGKEEKQRDAVRARVWLAEMLHDQQRDLEAAKELRAVVELMDKDRSLLRRVSEVRPIGGPAAVRARADFFQSLHYAGIKEPTKQIEHLDRAFKHDENDADVLIALYHLPDQTPERKRQTLDMIARAAEIFEKQIAAAGDNRDQLAMGCNQYAWLIGNTTGDYDKAVRCSQQSLEIRPDEPGYLDTLARCYYAKGDLDKALATQTRANQFDPHSGAIGRQLKFFQQKVAERKK